jgi:lipoprotein signal peptidase
MNPVAWTLIGTVKKREPSGSHPAFAGGIMTDRSEVALRPQRRQDDRRPARRGGRRKSDREPNRGWIPALVIASVIAGLDWMTKWLVTLTVPLGDLVEVVGGRVALWHVRNDAMILGLYSNLPLESRKVIAVIAGLLGVVLLFEVVSRGHRLPSRRQPWVWLFAGLALGGMLGNLGERAIHWGVTDFLSFRWGELWLPPGNIADLALFLSIPVAAVVIHFELLARAGRASERAGAEPQAEVALGRHGTERATG